MTMQNPQFNDFEKIYGGSPESNPIFLAKIKETFKEKEELENTVEPENEELLKIKDYINHLYESYILPFIDILEEENTKITDVQTNNGLIASANPSSETKQPVLLIKGVHNELVKKYLQLESQDKKSFKKVSEMDYEALISEETIGTITPALKANFVIDIKLPLSNGYKIIKPGKHLQKNAIIIDDNEEVKSQQDLTFINVPINKSNSYLPIPTGYELIWSNDEEGLLVSQPSNDQPFGVAILDAVSEDTLNFAIKPVPQIFIDLNKHLVTEEEKAFWNSVLPLSQEILDTISKHPDKIPTIIANLIGKNFHYICNNALGKFIRNNDKHLAMIIAELRVGHCDLLSWISCAYMRMFGIPAYVTSTLVTNESGSSFMKNYGHARVVFFNSKGQTVFFDPTLYCEDITEKVTFDEENVFKLDENFRDAETEQAKQDVLRAFAEIFLNSTNLEKTKNHRFDNLPTDNSNMGGFDFLNLLRKPTENRLEAIDFENTWEFDEADLYEKYGMPLYHNKPNAYKVYFEANLEKRALFKKTLATLKKLKIKIGDEYDFTRLHPEKEKEGLDIFYMSVPNIIKLVNFKPVSDINKLSKVFLVDDDQSGWDIDINNDTITSIKFENLILLADDFNFSEKFLKNLPTIISLLKNPQKDVSSYYKFNKRYWETNRLLRIEYNVFYMLIVKSFRSPQLRSKLKSKFKLEEEHFLNFAKTLTNEDRAKKRAIIAIEKINSLMSAVHENSSNFSEWQKVFKLNTHDLNKKAIKFVHILRKLPLKTTYNFSNENEAFTHDLVDYSPDSHDAKNIDHHASSRFDKLIAKTPLKLIPRKTLTILINFEELTPLNKTLGDIACIIKAVQLFCQSNDCEVTIITNQCDYAFKFNRQTPILNHIQTAYNICLIQNRSFFRSISDKSKLPNNLLVLGDNEVTIAMNKEIYGRKTNFIGKTFKELDLDLLPSFTAEYLRGDDLNAESE